MNFFEHKAATLCLLTVMVTLTGCAGGGGAPARFYVIDPIQTEPLSDATGNQSVEILGLILPQYLDRFQIATRAGPDRLKFSETHQWGENLRKNLLRTLARNLSRLLDTPDVGTPQNRLAKEPRFRLQLSITQFERDTGGTVQLAAGWQVIDLTEGAVPRSYQATLASDRNVASGDYDALVAQMRALFGQLSTQIAQSLVAPASDAS